MSYDPSRPAPEPGRVAITAEDVGTAPGFPDPAAGPRAALAAGVALVALALILHRLS